MEENKEKSFIEPEYSVTENEIGISTQEADHLLPILQDFIDDYEQNGSEETIEPWLAGKMQTALPEENQETVDGWAHEIITTVQVQEENRRELAKAMADGCSKELWLAEKLKEATAAMSPEERKRYYQTAQLEAKKAEADMAVAVLRENKESLADEAAGVTLVRQASEYSQHLQDVIDSGNADMMETILRSDQGVNMGPNLDGFIAETHHVQTFNMDAAAKNSQYHAEVLRPEGAAYSKNGFDIVIKDKAGNRVQQYQAKYGKDAQATIRMIKEGNYRNQRLLVPKDQVQEVQKAFPDKTVTSEITTPDGSKSVPLSKLEAKQKQAEAQSGNFDALKKDFSEYAAKDLAIGIAKNSAKAGIMGAGISAGIELINKKMNGQEVKARDVAKAAFRGGSDVGIKTAVAGSLKVAAEKGWIKAIPKGTPAATCANIAVVGIENVKIAAKIAKGELSVSEGINKMGETTVSIVGGVLATETGKGIGTAVGATIGSMLGPVGTAIGAGVGGFVGAAVGYMAGSKIGQTVYKGCKTVAKAVTTVAKKTVQTIGKAVDTVKQAAKKTWNKLTSWLFG